MGYIYNDEDNAPMFESETDRITKFTVYSSRAEMEAYERGEFPEENEPDHGCWDCLNYDPSAGCCMKDWNNLDPVYYNPDRDDKEPDDYCDDHDTDTDAVWEDFFGGDGQ